MGFKTLLMLYVVPACSSGLKKDPGLVGVGAKSIINLWRQQLG